MLTRDQILRARDFETKTIDVPEWGGEVLVRSLSGRSRDQLEAKYMAGELVGLKAFVVASCVCDEDGVLVFAAEDIEALHGRSASAIERVFEAAFSVSGLSPGAVQDAEGN